MNDLASFVFATGVCFCSSPTVAGDEWVGLNKGPDPQVSAVIMVSLASKATDGYPIVLLPSGILSAGVWWYLTELGGGKAAEQYATKRWSGLTMLNPLRDLAIPTLLIVSKICPLRMCRQAVAE